MNRTISLLAMSLAALNVSALEMQPSPYIKIAERNLFQLHAPVTSPKTPEPVAKPLRKTTLTGIATILKRPVAFLTIEGIKSQPAEFVMVVNGQFVNGIEVKSIDERAGAVRILNDGESQILNFEPTKTSDGVPFQNFPVPAPDPAPRTEPRPEATLTPEEQTALIELQRIKLQMAGDTMSEILPPTELTANDKDAATR